MQGGLSSVGSPSSESVVVGWSVLGSVVSGGRDYRRIVLGSYDLRYLSEVVERGLAV